MAEYIEIEDPKELKRLNRRLTAKLNAAATRVELRTVGYPRGSFPANVRFMSTQGENILWWAGEQSEDHFEAINLFGHGAPESKRSLNIDVQFNIPIVEFSRKSGGSFLRHVPTGSVVLAHRGIVTLGHGRIPKSRVFAEMFATQREAETSNGLSELLLIGELDSPTLIKEIDSFSSELRRAARGIKRDKNNGNPATSPDKAPDKLTSKLRQYFDEFSGQRRLKSRQKTIADCYHGDIVRELRDAFTEPDKLLKSREIDLVAITSKRAFLFEVKTSARPQNIYTAIGQLTVHTPAVKQHVGTMQVVRSIVLPERPTERLYKMLTNELNIRVLTFKRSAQDDVKIDGLDTFLADSDSNPRRP